MKLKAFAGFAEPYFEVGNIILWYEDFVVEPQSLQMLLITGKLKKDEKDNIEGFESFGLVDLDTGITVFETEDIEDLWKFLDTATPNAILMVKNENIVIDFKE